ncbi:hypothetical protein KY290_038312 [Solanum tuberosum]|uniref:Uncharacterized protein n=1 Tax=Solanum tuberosum TaxID=4113 RepID=A0ABQ7TZX5_SOLTU|nr:hypothetical protein KY285_035800 [Solanum tuberosum]KAH0739607.1 hypothetical protein KY290_038312 [Solanum tuberosum]
MKFSLCKNFGHDKKGCPIATNGYNTGTSTTRIATTPVSRADTTLEAYTCVTIGVTTLTAAQSARCNGGSSTIGTSDLKRSSKVKRGGANLGYKSPRTTGFRVLFGATGSVIKRFGTSDTLLHCAILKMPAPTNIDLGYKPNGLRWKGGTAVTQRQLQEQSYK